jgi:hypothetical protein
MPSGAGRALGDVPPSPLSMARGAGEGLTWPWLPRQQP